MIKTKEKSEIFQIGTYLIEDRKKSSLQYVYLCNCTSVYQIQNYKFSHQIFNSISNWITIVLLFLPMYLLFSVIPNIYPLPWAL